MNDLLKSNKGSALLIGFSFLTLAAGALFYAINQNNLSTGEGLKSNKIIKGKFEAKKVFSVAGYLISSNFIRCSSLWKSDVDRMKCIFDGETDAGTFDPIEFGFKNPDYNNGENGNKLLTFELSNELDKKANPNYGDALVSYPGTVSFELVDMNKSKNLKRMIGEMPADVVLLDKDPYFVKVDVILKVPKGGGKSEKVKSTAIFKRPIAETKTKIISSACSSQCPSSRGEHEFPACRGSFTIDGDTLTDVTAYTYNEGPGVVYNLQYARQIDFSRKVSGVTAPAPSVVTVPMKEGGVLRPGETSEWSDKVPCGAFVENITRVQTTRNRSKAGSSTSSTSTSISQHSEPAGKISYRLGVNVPGSEIEPMRLIKKVSHNEGTFTGKKIVNETNITIYVKPPH